MQNCCQPKLYQIQQQDIAIYHNRIDKSSKLFLDNRLHFYQVRQVLQTYCLKHQLPETPFHRGNLLRLLAYHATYLHNFVQLLLFYLGQQYKHSPSYLQNLASARPYSWHCGLPPMQFPQVIIHIAHAHDLSHIDSLTRLLLDTLIFLFGSQLIDVSLKDCQYHQSLYQSHDLTC